MKNSQQQERSPWGSLFSLLGLTLLCAFGIQVFVILIQILFHIGSPKDLLTIIQIDFQENKVFSYTMIMASSFGTFLLPTILLQRLDRKQSYYPCQHSSTLLFVIAIAFMLSFAPAMQLLADWNMDMRLPERFGALEAWMRLKEDEMAHLTKSIVMVDSWWLMLINLFAVAVMPAIAEEFYFRGALMNIMQRLVKNAHLSIWITAIIFSAIHVQFFGFFPRLFLGAFFGYMLLWTNNIWIPILAHFINNATAVIIAFYYTRLGMTFEDLQSSTLYSSYVYGISIVCSIGIAWYFYALTKNNNYLYGKRLD